MNLEPSETTGNGNQDNAPAELAGPATTKLTKPSCAAQDLQFRKVTQRWMVEACASRKLPAVTITDLKEDKHYFYPQSPSVFRGWAIGDAYVNVGGLVKVAFNPEGRQPGNYNQFPFDPRPYAKYSASYHRFSDDQEEHIYIARVDIDHIGNAPPEDQVEKVDTLLQSMPLWD